MSNKNNSASLWKTIRGALLTKLHHNLGYTKEMLALAEELNRYIVSVGGNASISSEKLAETYDLNIGHRTFSFSTINIPCNDPFEFRLVTCFEVSQVITEMPNNKAPGYDKVSVSVIKDCLPHLLPIIISIINESFASSVFPRVWKKAEAVPHHKEGDHEIPDNDRPILLLPVLSKVIEKLALRQYTCFLSEKNCLTKHQSGNKRYTYRSTEPLDLLVADHLFKAIDEKRVTAMALIDLSNAFDSICHSTLLKKLESLGTSHSALNCFRSYLTNRVQTTRIGSTISTPLVV